MVVELTSRGDFRHAIRLRGPVTGPDADFTAQLPLRGLRAGQRYDYRIGFETERGLVGETAEGFFRTAGRQRPVTFVWTGDTAGQGWGIDTSRGGMATYRTMHRTDPDFFLHSGDNIYADVALKGGAAAERRCLAEPGHRGGLQGRRDAARVPRPVPVQPDRRPRPGDVRRGAAGGAVGRPRDYEQLVPGRDPHRSPLHGEAVDALAARARRRSASTCRCRSRAAGTGSTARSRTARCWTCSAWTCVRSGRRTRRRTPRRRRSCAPSRRPGWCARSVGRGRPGR